LENSASSLAETIQQGELPAKASAIAPTILETGKSFTARGMEVLERVGKETMEFIVEETGMEVDKGSTGYFYLRGGERMASACAASLECCLP